MSSEWKRATWTFQPVTLGHTAVHIANALEDILLAGGWVRASWSAGVQSGYEWAYFYLRPDRYRLDLQHRKWGPSGNQPVTVTGTSMTKANLTGGGFGADASTKAAGYVEFSAQPGDGDTVTVTDGTTSKTFEFDSDALITPGRVQVAIGSGIENSIENLWSAINAQGLNLVATPHWHWWYTGDNYYQHNGICVTKTAGQARVDVSSFLENTAKTGMQTRTANYTGITYDPAKTNNFLFMAGEDGFYMEGGTDANYTNIAHGMVFAFYPDEALAGTRDRERTWTGQGIVYELTGLLRSDDRNSRFVETTGDRKNHTGRICGQTPRGASNTVNRDPANNRSVYFGPRDHLFSPIRAAQSMDPAAPGTFYFTLGVFQSNYDDLYRVSMLSVNQSQLGAWYDVRNQSGGTELTSGTSNEIHVFDARNSVRTMPKFGVCSSYLLPWNNITDRRTGVTFRVARVTDGGRNSNLCIVWPDNSNVAVIAATP
jgi:hypothetical protein